MNTTTTRDNNQKPYLFETATLCLVVDRHRYQLHLIRIKHYFFRYCVCYKRKNWTKILFSSSVIVCCCFHFCSFPFNVIFAAHNAKSTSLRLPCLIFIREYNVKTCMLDLKSLCYMQNTYHKISNGSNIDIDGIFCIYEFVYLVYIYSRGSFPLYYFFILLHFFCWLLLLLPSWYCVRSCLMPHIRYFFHLFCRIPFYLFLLYWSNWYSN